MAEEPRRIEIGQEGILPYLKWIMPMEYTYFGDFGGPEDVILYFSFLRDEYPNKIILPILRGWRCTIDGKCSVDETVLRFKDSVKADVKAAKEAGALGYGIFTYEALLDQSNNEKGGLTSIKKIIQY